MPGRLATNRRTPGPTARSRTSRPGADLQNTLYLFRPGYLGTLRRHFGNQDSNFVLSGVPIGWNPLQLQGMHIPDLIIAFNVDRAAIIEQWVTPLRTGASPRTSCWKQLQQSAPSGRSVRDAGNCRTCGSGRRYRPGTRRTTYAERRNDYAAFDIPEYWRFNPTGGQYHETGLGRRPPGGRGVPAGHHRPYGRNPSLGAQRSPEPRHLLGRRTAPLLGSSARTGRGKRPGGRGQADITRYGRRPRRQTRRPPWPSPMAQKHLPPRRMNPATLQTPQSPSRHGPRGWRKRPESRFQAPVVPWATP